MNTRFIKKGHGIAKQQTAFVALAAGLVLATAPARAAEVNVSAPAEPARVTLPFTIGSAVSALHPRHDAYSFFGINPVASAGLFASYDLVHAGTRVVIAPFFDWQQETTRGAWLSDGDTSVSVTSLSAGLFARFKIRSWLHPFVRAGGGVSFGSLEVRTSSGDAAGALNASAHASFANVGGGIMLRSRPVALTGILAHLFVGSLAVEGGESFASALTFNAKATSAPPSPGEAPIATSAPSLGSLGRTGWYLRGAVGIHF